VLNFLVAMFAVKASRRFTFVLILVVFLLSGAALDVLAQDPQVIIDAPASGEALQGVVSVSGSTKVEGFQVAEIAFAYQSDPTATWFLIQQSSTAVTKGPLASWDTTTITDGMYKLRVQVFLNDGQVLEYEVNGLRVRNYTAIETSTPAATITGPEQPTLTPSPLPDYQAVAVTAVPLPTNPAQLSQAHLQRSAAQGAGLVVAITILAVVYIGLRSFFRR
jgi:hypothetical protein